MRLAIVLLVVSLIGCAPVQEREFNYTQASDGSTITVGGGAAFDVRTGRHWWQRVVNAPHRMIVLHVAPSEWQFHSEQADSDIWTRLTTSAGSILPPVIPSVPVSPAP